MIDFHCFEWNFIFIFFFGFTYTDNDRHTSLPFWVWDIIVSMALFVPAWAEPFFGAFQEEDEPSNSPPKGIDPKIM